MTPEPLAGTSDGQKLSPIRGGGGLLRMHPVTWAILASLLAILAFHQICAAWGYPFYRAQHVGTALIYARGSIDLARPVIAGFTANQAPTPQELPLWQAAVAVLFRVLGESLGWALLVSWLVLVASIPPIYGLARAYGGADLARWAVLFFLLQPLVFFHGAMAATDGMCMALTVWFIYFADRHIRTASIPVWLGAVAFGALSAVTKAPFFFAAGVASVWLLVQQRARPARWLSLAVAGGLAGLALMGWNHHCETCYAQAEFPLMELRMRVNPVIVHWYFGTLADRFNILNWGQAGWRILNACFGSWALAGLALVGLLQPPARVSRAWLLGAFAAIVVFFHIIVVAAHRHYYLMISPAIAIMCACGLEYFRLRQPSFPAGARRVLGASAGLVLVLALIQGFFGMEEQLRFDRYPRSVASRIQQQTRAEDRILTHGLGWGAPIWSPTDPQMLSWGDLNALAETKIVARLKELGYNKLVVVNESPLGHALQQINPGESDRKRKLPTTQLPDKVGAWKTAYEDEDLLIKLLP